ncbi:hydroxyacid dehydrogenase [Microlunatus speluncae]|uniref:hydroxyacid dehydrogenase n=1 Tax=Microlunatus speluncae TaxID=2594267 RepID=UPI0012660EF1|nr:hydroxyacid dehydrogenase [Microlunatus speluncae]
MAPKAVFAMNPGLERRFFDTDRLRRLSELVDLDPELVIRDWRDAPEDLELAITGWGAPKLDSAALTGLPKLRGVIHAAGSVRSMLPSELYDTEGWQRDLQVSSAAHANALPVAEFTLATILFAGKDVIWISRAFTATEAPVDKGFAIGNYGRTIGIVGASMVGARVIELLRPFDFTVLVYDPYLSAERATELGATKVDELVDLARASDVLSLHAPSIPATNGMISAEVLAALPDGATVINTARPSVIDQDALTAELIKGRLRAFLDVTSPEPLPPGHPLWGLPNVFITPHLAGSAGNEVGRMGQAAVEEVARFVAGTPFAHRVTAADMTRLA